MTRNKLSMTLTILVVIVMVVSSSQISTQCPRHCVCHDKFVSCKHKSLQSVPADIPWTTERLDLSFNSIASLPADSFANLSRLRLLRLDHNNMKSIDENAFRGNLNHLKDLYLTHNDLSRLHPDTFDKKLNELRHVYLSDNEFEQIPPLKATQMTRLNLDNNRIRSAHIDKSFTINIGLQTLVLTKNFIKRIDANDLEVLRECRLKSLMMKLNELEWIDPRAFEPVKHSLENLELEGNESLNSTIIERALAGFSGGQSMIYLELRRTNLTEISEGFFKPFNGNKLHRLDVSNNGALTKVNDNSFDGLNSVQYIHLERCGISSPGIRLSAMSGLRMANMSHNKLMRCPFRLPRSLEVLDLQWNNIQNVKVNDFKSLSSLKVLNLHRNWIISIEPDSFSDLGKLERLDLSENRLSVVQTGVFQPHLSRLTCLDISRQNPCMKAVSFSLPPFTKVNLSSNCLSISAQESSPLMIDQLSQLTNLSMSLNELKKQDESLMMVENIFKRNDSSRKKIIGTDQDASLTTSHNVIQTDLSLNKLSVMSSRLSSKNNRILRRISMDKSRWSSSLCYSVDWMSIVRQRIAGPEKNICWRESQRSYVKNNGALSIDSSLKPVFVIRDGTYDSGICQIRLQFFLPSLTALWIIFKLLKGISIMRKFRKTRTENKIHDDDGRKSTAEQSTQTETECRLENSFESKEDSEIHKSIILKNELVKHAGESRNEDYLIMEIIEDSVDIVFLSQQDHPSLSETGLLTVRQINSLKECFVQNLVVKCECLVIDYPWFDSEILHELMRHRQNLYQKNYIFTSFEVNVECSFGNISKKVLYNSRNLVKLLSNCI